ncbi:MAG: response regulator transcription factor [Armatimonadetes bacterium]|nr:response regulator transcription factor [Armatimonadota bacterium]
MKRIVVAEDSPLQIEMLKAALGRHPEYQLVFFSDGLELYRHLLREPADLAVLDIVMPRLSGLAVTRLLKFHRDHRNLRVLVVSSITDADIAERARACGADSFLPKPLDFEALERKVAELLR